MSIATLTEVYGEVRRLAIAGSVVAPGDFRLKKLVPPLQRSGEKAPIFAKVAESATRLIESDEKTSAEALLELSTLVHAILYTQGQTGAEGELVSIATANVESFHTRTTARTLKPLLEALTTTGAGRLEVIKDAYGRNAFQDLRLIKPALAALDDPYPEIGDFVADKILPMYGPAIVPELRAKLDLKGRGGHARRLVLLHRLDPEGTAPLVKEALESGSKEMRVAAIECLGRWPERLKSLLRPVNVLLDLVSSKAKEVRNAAAMALARSKEDAAIAPFEAAIKKGDVEHFVGPIRESDNFKLTQLVLDAADAQWTELIAGKEKDKQALAQRIKRMVALLDCLYGKRDKAVEAFVLKCFAAREQVLKIKGEPSGQDVIQSLLALLTAGPPAMQKALVDSHKSLEPEDLPRAFHAACATRSPAEVFELFSPYLAANVNEKKKQRDPAYARREAIAQALLDGHGRGRSLYDVDREAAEPLNEFDPRWLDVAVAQNDVRLVKAIARTGHPAANALLTEAFESSLKASKGSDEAVLIVDTMIRVQHPAATSSLIELLARQAKDVHSYRFTWSARLVPRLPKESVPELEALLPKLPEKPMDTLLGHIAELKARA